MTRPPMLHLRPGSTLANSLEFLSMGHPEVLLTTKERCYSVRPLVPCLSRGSMPAHSTKRDLTLIIQHLDTAEHRTDDVLGDVYVLSAHDWSEARRIADEGDARETKKQKRFKAKRKPAHKVAKKAARKSAKARR